MWAKWAPGFFHAGSDRQMWDVNEMAQMPAATKPAEFFG
jgi:hypothetical protein